MIYCQHNDIDRKGITHYVRTGAEYKFNDNAHLDLAYTGVFNPNNDNHSYSDGNITTSRQPDKKGDSNAQYRFRLSL